VWFAIGQMDVRLRRWKDADDAFNKAEPLSTKKEDRLYLLFLRGELADRQKHMDQAEQFFRQALDLDKDNAMTLNYLGYMLADKGVRLPEALKLIRKAVDIEPQNGAYLDSLGWVYFKLGEYELAEDNLRQAVERDQTDPPSTSTWETCMRKPTASASRPRNGSYPSPNLPSPLQPTLSPAT